MKQKTGKCIDCPEGTQETPLTAKRCRNHYWRHRSKENAKKPKNQKKRAEKKVMGVYMASQILQIPKCCEECGEPLSYTQQWQAKSMVAHILPKSIFKSVAIHPQNRWFACIRCHGDYDNRGVQYVVTMEVLPVLRERVKHLLPDLTGKELNRVPTYLLD